MVALGKRRVFHFQGSILIALQHKILSVFMYHCVPYQGGRLLCLGGSGSELGEIHSNLQSDASITRGHFAMTL